jgi:hypothetical protein
MVRDSTRRRRVVMVRVRARIAPWRGDRDLRVMAGVSERCGVKHANHRKKPENICNRRRASEGEAYVTRRCHGGWSARAVSVPLQLLAKR